MFVPQKHENASPTALYNIHEFFKLRKKCSLHSQTPCAALTSLTFTYYALCGILPHRSCRWEQKKWGKWLHYVGLELLIWKPLNSFNCCVFNSWPLYEIGELHFQFLAGQSSQMWCFQEEKFCTELHLCFFPTGVPSQKNTENFFCQFLFECILWVICNSCEVFGL